MCVQIIYIYIISFQNLWSGCISELRFGFLGVGRKEGLVKKDNIVLLLYYVESLTGSTVPFHN